MSFIKKNSVQNHRLHLTHRIFLFLSHSVLDSHNLDSTEGSRAVTLENIPDLGVSDPP